MKLAPPRTRTRPVIQSPADEPQQAIADAVVRNMHVVETAINKLRAPPRDLRQFNKRHQRALKASVKEFGMVKPILFDTDNVIIAGYAVWRAAKALGLESVPAICISDLTPEQIRLYRIADNQISTLTTFNSEELRLELSELSDLGLNFEVELDLELTGFATAEIDNILLNSPAVPELEDHGADDEEAKAAQPVSRAGDLWFVGEHRIFCGNSLEETSYRALMGNELAQMIVADCPFNVPVAGHVSGRKDAREFAFASGEMSPEEFIRFLETSFKFCVQFSVDGSIHYHFIDWRHVWEMLSAGREAYTEHKNILVWNKTNASMGWYRSQHELICVFKAGKAPHIDNFGLGETGRYRTNVVTYPGANTFRKGRDEDLAAHPTVKNFSLIADLIRDCSKRGGIILDNFGGSGTTMLAAEWTGRRARLIEIDPLYVDEALRRWMKQTGREVTLAGTGQTFEEVAEARGVALNDEADAYSADMSDGSSAGEGDDEEA